jgi:hypothetical protein
MYVVAECYEIGLGCIQNLQLAFDYYKKVADSNHTNAQYIVGEYYRIGICCTKNLELSFNYYKKAADNNHSLAQSQLADCYYNGYGCTKSISESLRYYELSLKSGLPVKDYINIIYYDNEYVDSITNKINNDSNDECQICLYNEGDWCELKKCKHAFHINCLIQSIISNNIHKCPYCKTDI